MMLCPDVWGLMKKYPDCIYFFSTLCHTVMRLFLSLSGHVVHAHNQQDLTVAIQSYVIITNK